jgi:hypothetical protein
MKKGARRYFSRTSYDPLIDGSDGPGNLKIEASVFVHSSVFYASIDYSLTLMLDLILELTSVSVRYSTKSAKSLVFAHVPQLSVTCPQITCLALLIGPWFS